MVSINLSCFTNGKPSFFEGKIKTIYLQKVTQTGGINYNEYANKFSLRAKKKLFIPLLVSLFSFKFQV